MDRLPAQHSARLSSSQSQAPIPLPVNVDTTDARIVDDDEASHPDQRDSRDIYLPHHVEFVSHIAVDVGGSLAKVVYFTRSWHSSEDADPSDAIAITLPTAPHLVPFPPSSSSIAQPSTVASGSGSGQRSRQPSANGSLPRSPDYSMHSQSSGTLTPSAILSDSQGLTHHHNSAMRAMRSSLLRKRSLPPNIPGGRLNFIKFETSDIESCITFLQELIESSAKANSVTIQEMRKVVKLMATGGGAHMFYELFEKELGIEIHREDEMGCLITGLNFITLIPDEVFWYSDELVSALHSPLPDKILGRADPPRATTSSPSQAEPLPRPSPNPPLYAPMFESNPSPKLPCLLVNIGSGVSIIKVDDYGKFERVSGTSLGGGTLWGLLSMLTDAESFDEMLELSEKGDNSTVDMLVSDVYGNSNALNAFGLKSSTIASSFGKVFRRESRGTGGAKDRKKRFSPQDICKSLLYAVSNNIGQIAHMTAEKYQLDRIYFGGCFIRGHQATISTLSYAIRFWSKGTKRAFFLRHEGYLGAIGAWIKHLDDPVTSLPGDLGSGATKAGVLKEVSMGLEGPQESDQTASGGVDTPMIENSELVLPSTETDAAPMVNGVSSSRSSHQSQRQTQDEGMDMLSMLNSLQDNRHAFVQPIVAAHAGVENGTSSLVNGEEGEAGKDWAKEGQDRPDEGEEDEELEATEDLKQLLAQLDAADGAANGLESKLDGLLERLDGLLGSEED